jgi:hypothetical protein
MTSTAESYIEQLDSIAGWFSPRDAALFTYLLRTQVAAGAFGDLLEIGCFMGKSAILLGYGQGPDELVVCDIFGNPGLHHCCTDHPLFTAATADRFYANWDLYHPVRPVAYACDSLDLTHFIDNRRFRFIHIDGCHEFGCVATDISLAIGHAAPGCVIALDDYRATELPGVAAAVWQAVLAKLLFPFAVTDAKLYASASAEDAGVWLERLRRWHKTYELPGCEVVVMPPG